MSAPSIYVAAPFSEWKLVREVQAELRYQGATITEDWTAGIESLPTGMTDADAGEDVALKAAVADIQGVFTADACIFLTVEDKSKGCGMWVELGAAIMCQNMKRALAPTEMMRIAVCGPQRDRTIFSRLGKRFADWHDAVPYVLGVST